MKYLVLSDIHGASAELEKVLSYFKMLNCDLIVLLGDLLNHGPRNIIPESYNPPKVVDLLAPFSNRIICVRGNCDGEVDTMMFNFPCNAPYAHLYFPKTDGLQKIFLTHGHLYRFDTEAEIEKLGLKAGDVVLSGHTHISGQFEKAGGVVNVNPGSISIPKGNTQAGFATLDENGIQLYNLDGKKILEYHFE